MHSYHHYFHELITWLGIDLGPGAPEWLHPVMHFVVVLVPLALVLWLGRYLVRVMLKSRCAMQQQTVRDEPVTVHIRGLPCNLRAFMFSYLWRVQMILLVISLLGMPVLYGMLELPKQIVNNALDAAKFPIKLAGFELEQTSFLFILCGLYLLAITINAVHKYWLNVWKGWMAERFLRRLRLMIFRHWRSLPIEERRSDAIPMIIQEVEPIGGFTSEVVTLPVMQGGTFATIMLFMFVQDPVLGMAALSMLPLQLYFLPRLQRQVNKRARERIKEVRRLGGRLGEQSETVQLTTQSFREACTSFSELEQIRRRIHRIKFFMKVLNNFLTALQERRPMRQA